jgi:membrane-bound ClpP family serine protease
MMKKISFKGFVVPRWLAWVMVFAGIIVFLIGIPFLLYNLFLWSYLRRFDATGIVLMVIGAVVAYFKKCSEINNCS